MLINPVERYYYNKSWKEGRQEGRKEGRKEGRMYVAKNLLADGFPIDRVVRLTELSEEEILNG